MLTRSQVARRIGRSVSTVRKMEGDVLHPVVDGLGIHRFDAAEVETIAAQVRTTGRALDCGAEFELLRAERFNERQEVPRRDSKFRVGATSKERRNSSERVNEREYAKWKRRVEEACEALMQSLPMVDDDALEAYERVREILAQR